MTTDTAERDRPVAWLWVCNDPGGYTHPTLSRIGASWIDVATEGMPTADDITLEQLGTSRIEYAYARHSTQQSPDCTPHPWDAEGTVLPGCDPQPVIAEGDGE